VAEPERDYGGVDTGVEKPHGGGMTKDVWGDVLAAQ
jgi:hypothetical protein